MKKGGVTKGGNRKKKVHKNKVTKVIHESTKEIKVDRSLTDNFIALQRVMVNLSMKFDSLSTQISKLLELFEVSAKNLARKELETPTRSIGTNAEMKAIKDRLDNLTSQAGLIGRGLALIHEVNSEKSGNQGMLPSMMPPRQMQPMTQVRPNVKPMVPVVLPTEQKKPNLETISSELSDYEKSDSIVGSSSTERP